MPTREELENMKSYEPTDDVKKLVKEKVEEIRRLKGMLQPDVEDMTEARKQIEHAELAKRFTELTGGYHKVIEVHDCGYDGWTLCSCGKKDCTEKNPTYSNAADILREMKEFLEEERYKDFLYNLLNEFQHLTYLQVLNDFLNDYILNATALLGKAVEFLEGK